MGSDTPANLRFEQAQVALNSTNASYIELRDAARTSAARLADALAALRIGRTIEAYELLMDIQYDLRAALNESA